MPTHLLIIDPQVDFMEGGALAVPGATGDMQRLACAIERIGAYLDGVTVTLDSHLVNQIFHPSFWEGPDGSSPPPFTVIGQEALAQGRWWPRDGALELLDMPARSRAQWARHYLDRLADGGRLPLMIWPEHCLIGSPGHALQPDLARALGSWARRTGRNPSFILKGMSPLTEHYGAFAAEVEVPGQAGTALNRGVLERLARADRLLIAGEASSHCVKASVEQLIAHAEAGQIARLALLTDCTSPVPAVPGADFPALAKAWMERMRGMGMRLVRAGELRQDGSQWA